MLTTQYKAVIFDLDGTLVDSMWVWNQIDRDFLGQYGIQVPEDMEKDLEGKSFSETASYFKKRFQLTLSEAEIKESWNQMAYEAYTTKVTLKPGAKEFLELLKAHDIKMGIASSNSVELVSAVLEALHIREYFTKVVTSCEVGRGKPFPDVYLKVSEHLGVKPEECLVFEDIPNGILAGKAAGMTAWGIEDRQSEMIKRQIKAVADSYVKDYFEVMNRLVQC